MRGPAGRLALAALLTQLAQVGNFRVEPPGLFRGRGEHPKMGLIKARCRSKFSSPRI